MPKKDLRDRIISSRDGDVAHKVKYGSVTDGVFRAYCNEVITTPVELLDEDDYDEHCDICFDEVEEDESYNPDDRRTEGIEWPRNTDIDKR